MRYVAALRPWGEQRYAEGLPPTEFHFTGQRELSVLGLHFYGARWYDSLLGRFIQADTIVPLESQVVQAWDRYAYTNNNPVRYTDPTGHDVGCAGRDASACEYDVPLWKRSAASFETRAKRELLVGNRNNRLSETILSSDSPISRGIYFEWAAGNVIKSALSGGENLGQAATDLALIGLTNFSTGLLGLAMGGYVAPVTANRIAGNAFRDEIAQGFKEMGYGVETEVVKNTPFGRRFIDIEVSSLEGVLLGGIETKLGSSRYLPSQRAKDSWLFSALDYVVSLVRDR
jgi:RHS repeat-associated protein